MKLKFSRLGAGLAAATVVGAGMMAAPAAWASGGQHSAAAKVGVEVATKPKCTDTWTNLSGGLWGTGSNWSTGNVPGSSDVACITNTTKSYKVKLEGGYNVGSIVLGKKTGTTTQTLQELGTPAQGDASISISGVAIVYNTGLWQMNSKGDGNVWTHGGTIENYGTFETSRGKGWSREIQSSFDNESGATFDIDAVSMADGGGATYMGNGTFTNDGTVNVGDTSELDLQSNSGEVFVFEGGTLNSTEGATSNALVEIDNDSITLSGGKETGAPVQVNGGSITDSAGKGSYEVYNNTSITGTIPKGQTITVAGNGNSDIKLAFDGNVTNNGTLILTEGDAVESNSGGNSWIVAGTGVPDLTNNGTFELLPGGGWSRYVNIPVTNDSAGTVDVQGVDNDVVSSDIQNNGTFDMGDDAVINLDGTSYGDSSFNEGGTATLGVTVDGSGSSEIMQGACSAGGCQTEGIQIAGALDVTTVGSAGSGSWDIIDSQQVSVEGVFTSTTAGYSATYSGENVYIDYGPDGSTAHAV